MKKKTTTFLAMAATAIAFALAGCQGNKEESEILKPLSEHIVGRWEQVAGYRVDGNGNKVEDEANDDEGYVLVSYLRPGGTGVGIRTDPDGWQQLSDATWKVDEEKLGCYLTGRGKTYYYTIRTLTADQMVTEGNFGTEASTNETSTDHFRFEHKRLSDEPSLAERVVGKWVSSKAYRKVNGEWQEAPNCRPDEGWYHFHETGLVDAYQRSGDKEQAVEMKWSANVKANRMRVVKDEWSDEWDFTLTDADTMEIYDNEGIDFATGERLTGEFKDVLVRVK